MEIPHNSEQNDRFQLKKFEVHLNLSMINQIYIRSSLKHVLQTYSMFCKGFIFYSPDYLLFQVASLPLLENVYGEILIKFDPQSSLGKWHHKIAVAIQLLWYGNNENNVAKRYQKPLIPYSIEVMIPGKYFDTLNTNRFQTLIFLDMPNTRSR